MRKSLVVSGIVALVCVILLTMLAYGFSFKVSTMYDQRMHRDIQGFTQELTMAGIPQAQIKAFRSILLDVNRHTLSYVTSEVFNVVGFIAAVGIIIMNFSLVLARRIDDKKKDNGCSS